MFHSIHGGVRKILDKSQQIGHYDIQIIKKFRQELYKALLQSILNA